MPLDGLRAWVGEVERKLDVRTRVFLVLAVIAIGGAGASIYLAIDARESSVSEGDVQALQEKLEARIGEGGASTAGTDAAQLEAELKALQAQVEQLNGEGGGSEKGKGDSGSSGSGQSGSGTSSGGGNGAGGDSSEGTSGAAGDDGASSAKLQELLDQAKEQSGHADGEQAGK